MPNELFYRSLLACERSYRDGHTLPVLCDEHSIKLENDFCDIGTYKDIVFIAFRGSDDLEDWKSNLSLDYEHDLFARILSHLLISNYRYRKIVLTGHSRGGVYAQEMALYLKDKLFHVEACITFGSPMLENVSKHRGKYNHYRFINGSDPVPKMPPFFIRLFKNYGHHGEKIQLKKDRSWFSWSIIRGVKKYHLLKTYIDSFKNKYNIR